MPASASAVLRSHWLRRTFSATCSPRCRSRSTGHSGRRLAGDRHENGTVEYIGVKSTRLRSLNGEQIVLSNSDVLKSRVRNYTPIFERRAELRLQIAYETPRHLIRELPKIIEAAIRAEKNARFERAHFARYGDYALQFEAIYVVEDGDYTAFMDAQQSVNLRLLDEFARRGITLAYPTTRSMSIPLPSAPTDPG